jgi:hypothetical protein
MKLSRQFLVAVAAASSLLVAGPAFAGQLEHDRFLDSGTEVFDDFCGVDGVVHTFEVWVNHHVNQRGSDQLAYFGDSVHGTESFTNPLTGQSYTHTFNDVIKDWKVTDNGDGTLTIEGLAAGGDKWFSSDGDLRFLDTGTIRFAVIVDHAGTPSDPSDDVFQVDLGVTRPSTGRNDTETRDFCEDFLIATT